MGGEIQGLTPQNEYRPTQYLQGSMAFCFDDKSALLLPSNFSKH